MQCNTLYVPMQCTVCLSAPYCVSQCNALCDSVQCTACPSAIHCMSQCSALCPCAVHFVSQCNVCLWYAHRNRIDLFPQVEWCCLGIFLCREQILRAYIHPVIVTMPFTMAAIQVCNKTQSVIVNVIIGYNRYRAQSTLEEQGKPVFRTDKSHSFLGKLEQGICSSFEQMSGGKQSPRRPFFSKNGRPSPLQDSNLHNIFRHLMY